MNLTEDQKRLLTEFLGECWHEFSKDVEGFDGPCVKCRTWRSSSIVRTFLTYQDLGDVKDKLVEKGLWAAFLEYVICQNKGYKDEWFFQDEDTNIFLNPAGINWIFRPLNEQGNPHFCRLAAEFLEANNG